jgi:Domain of unknown function (DUF4440)
MINDLSEPLLDKTQQDVWKQEIAYWKALKDADVKSLLALLHSRLIIWPSWSKHSMNKNNFEEHLKENLRANKTSIQLKSESVRVIGDIAIIYYLTTYQHENDFKKVDKITHIWLFDSGKWLMIGGTSSEFSY